MKSVLLAIVAAVILAGCQSVQEKPSVRDIVAEIRHVVKKNYSLGQEELAYVGQPVVQLKDYYYNPIPIFTSPVAFSASLEDGGADVHYAAGTELRGIALFDYEGVTYFIASPSPLMPGNSMLLIDSKGHYRGLGFTYEDEEFDACDDEDDVCIKPAVINFVRSHKEGIDKAAPGFINYELVYSGATKDTINLLYREYTPDNMARAAFTQNLTYDRASSSIRFRDVQIHVIEASNESLRYVVQADGLAPTEQ